MEEKEKKKASEEEVKTENKAKNIFEDVKDDTSSFKKEDIESGKIMAILAYIGILCLIPFFAEKNNKYVVYHAKQGLNLFLIEVIASVAVGFFSAVAAFLWFLLFFVGILSFAVSAGSFALSIIGIINVCNGKAKELPIINKFKLIK